MISKVFNYIKKCPVQLINFLYFSLQSNPTLFWIHKAQIMVSECENMISTTTEIEETMIFLIKLLKKKPWNRKYRRYI